MYLGGIAPKLNGWEGVVSPHLIRKRLKTFEELGVNENIRRAIEELGFEHPMPVQEEVIPYLLGNKNDVIALAQTGTGKTAAFGLPLCRRSTHKIVPPRLLFLVRHANFAFRLPTT